MEWLARAMEYYPYVVHPITILGASFLVLIHLEWSAQGEDRSALWQRYAGFLGAGIVALLPTVAYFAISGSGVIEATKGNSWLMDGLVAGGLLVAAGITWYLWRRYEWGSLVPGAMQALVAVTVTYIALSLVWNVSGHVIIALMPTLYLTLVDRKFWPLLALPVVMVPNRVFLEAHTWTQSIAGFLIATVVTVALYGLQTGWYRRREVEPIGV